MLIAVTITSLLSFAQSAPATDAPSPFRRLTHSVNAYACFAPDGQSIVYQSNAAGSFDLYVIRMDGSGGKRLLFSSNRGNSDAADYDIYEMAADGSDLRCVTTGPDVDTYASWSPDSRRIVTRRVVNGNNEVFVMDRDGKNALNLTNASTYNGWPVWSPDGTRIAYAGGPEDCDHYIYLMKPDGTGRVQLTQRSPRLGFCYDTQPVVLARWALAGIHALSADGGLRELRDLRVRPRDIEELKRARRAPRTPACALSMAT